MIPEDLVPPDCPWPIVLGIDPGTLRAGYGAVVVAPEAPRLVCCGVLSAAPSRPSPWRLGRLQAELEQLIERLRPGILAIETAFTARNARSALRIGEARGMVLAAAARKGLEIVEIAPAAAKKAVCGNGNGSKEQVASMVATILGDELAVPYDATDALAVALAHVHRLRLAGLRAAAGGSLPVPRASRPMGSRAPGNVQRG